jgi:hypothetical protein
MTKTNTFGEAVIILTSVSKQLRLDAGEIVCSQQRLVRVVPLKACCKVYHSGVAECAIFATRNSLKSQKARKSKSPFSNFCAITSKLCLRWTPKAVENHHPAPQSVGRSIPNTACHAA